MTNNILKKNGFVVETTIHQPLLELVKVADYETISLLGANLFPYFVINEQVPKVDAEAAKVDDGLFLAIDTLFDFNGHLLQLCRFDMAVFFLPLWIIDDGGKEIGIDGVICVNHVDTIMVSRSLWDGFILCLFMF